MSLKRKNVENVSSMMHNLSGHFERKPEPVRKGCICTYKQAVAGAQPRRTFSSNVVTLSLAISRMTVTTAVQLL